MMSENTVEINKGGRPAAPIPNDRWNVRVSPDVGVYWRTRFWDELSQQVRKGEMSKLVDRLLREEMNRELKGTVK
ncbi:MAG: hypothetical protein ACKOX6_00770 [Bdellovibrio sp.]